VSWYFNLTALPQFGWPTYVVMVGLCSLGALILKELLRADKLGASLYYPVLLLGAYISNCAFVQGGLYIIGDNDVVPSIVATTVGMTLSLLAILTAKRALHNHL
jgi:hypothetical protein